MSFYEHVFIARQDLTPSDVDKLADKYADIITKEGGKITKRENWGLRTLAYRINKNKKGFYVLFNIDASPKAVAEMERLEKIDEDILRILTIKVKELNNKPSPMMAKGKKSEGEA